MKQGDKLMVPLDGAMVQATVVSEHGAVLKVATWRKKRWIEFPVAVKDCREVKDHSEEDEE